MAPGVRGRPSGLRRTIGLLALGTTGIVLYDVFGNPRSARWEDARGWFSWGARPSLLADAGGLYLLWAMAILAYAFLALASARSLPSGARRAGRIAIGLALIAVVTALLVVGLGARGVR